MLYSFLTGYSRRNVRIGLGSYALGTLSVWFSSDLCSFFFSLSSRLEVLYVSYTYL